MKFLIVVDLQNDFINGTLGTAEAEAIVPKAVEKINNWDGVIIATRDTHNADIWEQEKANIFRLSIVSDIQMVI